MMINTPKSILCFSMLMLLCSLPLLAQQEVIPFKAKNAVFVELGGNGLLYSLNCERLFYQKGMFKSAARIGLAAYPIKLGAEKNTYWSFALPMEVVGLIGRSRHHMELGVGFTPYYYPDGKLEIVSMYSEFERYRLTSYVPFRVGYRYQKPDGGFLFRAGLMPLWSSNPEMVRNWRIHAGISLGMSF